MAAKASVPVEAFPCINRFRGHGPLLQGGCAIDRWIGPSFCRSGPWPRKRRFRSKCFLASTAFGAMGPSYKTAAPCRPSAHRTCSRTSIDGSSTLPRNASITACVVGAFPSPTARFRSQRS